MFVIDLTHISRERKEKKNHFHFRQEYVIPVSNISHFLKKMGHHSSKHYGLENNTSSRPRSSKMSQPSATNFTTSNSARQTDLSSFAVITVIFNPVKYTSRYEHYRKFAAHMSQSGVNLITVECVFESTTRFGLPQQNFEITNAGDRHHIRLVAPSILWMKENLINIAIQRLPLHIEYIAWIDADIEFDVCFEEKFEVFFEIEEYYIDLLLTKCT